MKEKTNTNSRSLKWEQNGELAHKDLSELIERLKNVESEHNSSELSRLNSKSNKNRTADTLKKEKIKKSTEKIGFFDQITKIEEEIIKPEKIMNILYFNIILQKKQYCFSLVF